MHSTFAHVLQGLVGFSCFANLLCLVEFVSVCVAKCFGIFNLSWIFREVVHISRIHPCGVDPICSAPSLCHAVCLHLVSAACNIVECFCSPNIQVKLPSCLQDSDFLVLRDTSSTQCHSVACTSLNFLFDSPPVPLESYNWRCGARSVPQERSK